jgi:hypothetical protein
MKTASYSLVKVSFSPPYAVTKHRQQMKSIVADGKELRLDIIAPFPGDLTHKMRVLLVARLSG